MRPGQNHRDAVAVYTPKIYAFLCDVPSLVGFASSTPPLAARSRRKHVIAWRGWGFSRGALGNSRGKKGVNEECASRTCLSLGSMFSISATMSVAAFLRFHDQERRWSEDCSRKRKRLRAK